MKKENKKTTTTWLPYIRVVDVRESTQKAGAAGGRVLIGPTALHGLQVAIIADPDLI